MQWPKSFNVNFIHYHVNLCHYNNSGEVVDRNKTTLRVVSSQSESLIEMLHSTSALWHCPNSTVALRLLENVKVTNLE